MRIDFSLLVATLLAGGCAGPAERTAAPEPAASAQAQAAGTLPSDRAAQAARAAAAAETARLEAIRAQSAGEPRYLRFKAQETALVTAQDDGSLTYLEFAAPPDNPPEFFDQDGRALRTAAAGRVVAIEGLHSGILVRRADRASFVSPNPRALSLPRRPLPASADYAEARALLESQAEQLQAMRRAMEAARGGGMQARPEFAATTRTGGPDALPVPTASFRFSRFAPAAGLPQPAALTSSSGVSPPPPPLAAANASAAAPERGLVRVFFATASRAIVAPDDGLGLLLREAANADEIRVTGFTDATGSHATNDALAQARADAVVRILLRRGIPPDRIFSNSVGAAGFIADNASERGRALNRRVEVLMLRQGVPMTFGDAARAMR